MNNGREILQEGDLGVVQKVISNLRVEHHIVNEIIREQIFSIIEKECTVLYYPFDEENVKACYLPRIDHRGNLINFVLINTNQPLSEQVFACAHELAHILKVAQSGGEMLTETESSCSPHDYQEAIADRFAAELLMPANTFRDYAQQKIEEKLSPLELVFSLMDMFLTSFKAVTYRLEEVGMMPSAVKDIYIGIANAQPMELKALEKKHGLCEQNNLVSNRKSFGDFIEIVESLYDKALINEMKYKHLLSLFGVANSSEQGKEIEKILNEKSNVIPNPDVPMGGKNGENPHE